MRRALKWLFALTALVLLANLLYAAKSLAGIDIDPGTHHGDLFPLGQWIYHRFALHDPVLSFEGSYRSVHVTGRQGEVDGEVAAGWRDNSTWSSVTIHYARVGDAQRVTITRADKGGACQLAQWVSAEAGHRYTLTIRLRSATDQPMKLTALLRQVGKPYRAIAEATVSVGTEWTTLTATGVPTDADIANGQLMVIVRASEVGSFDIDAATLAAE